MCANYSSAFLSRMFTAFAIVITLASSPALAQESGQPTLGFFGAIGESLFGDVYAEPSKWRPLPARTFFSEGWNKPWVSPPTGEGGAPRQGWLNSFDGVFYRLGVFTGGLAEDFNENGNLYTAGLTLYTPFNERFEFRFDIPFVVSNREELGGNYQTNFGDSGLRHASSYQRAATLHSRSMWGSASRPGPSTTATVLRQ